MEHANTKESSVRGALSGLIPNIGVPRQKRRALVASVVILVLTSDIHTRYIEIPGFQKKTGSGLRSKYSQELYTEETFCTVTKEAAYIIAGIIPIEIYTEERRALY